MTTSRNDANGELPTFLVIGADPYDVEWLRGTLSGHPEVYVGPEVAYFSSLKRIRALGRDWYTSQFDPEPGHRAVGEITAQYLLPRNDPISVAKRVKRAVPDARLVAVLRNPLDRVFLELKALVLTGRLEEDLLVDLLQELEPDNDPLGLISNGWYAQSIRQFVRRFEDQLLVVLHEELRDDPRAVYERVVRHLDVDPSFVPEAVDVLDSPEVPRPDLPEEELERLRGYFRMDVARLEHLLGRELEPWREFRSKGALKLWTGQWQLPRYWERSSGWIEELLSNVAPDQLGLETPCPHWTVGDLIGHMVGQLSDAVTALAGAPALVESPGPDARAAFRDASTAFARAIANSEEMPPSVDLDDDDVPSHFFACTVFVSQVLHGWDLAVATGQSSEIPSEILAPTERIGRPFLSEMPRCSETIDEAVPPPEHATPTEVFVAFGGRDADAWRRSSRERPERQQTGI